MPEQTHRGEYRSFLTHISPDGKEIKLQRFEMEGFCWKLYLEATFGEPEPKMLWFEAAIRRVVWGGLYIESLINILGRIVLWSAVKPEYDSTALWDMIERSSPAYKVEMLGEFNKRPSAEVKAISKRVNIVADLRNRLVHFKEEPIVSPILYDDGENTMHGILKMNIEKDLSREAVVVFDTHVIAARKWLLDLPQAAQLLSL